MALEDNMQKGDCIPVHKLSNSCHCVDRFLYATHGGQYRSGCRIWNGHFAKKMLYLGSAEGIYDFTIIPDPDPDL